MNPETGRALPHYQAMADAVGREQRYEVALTWDQVDDVMSALRAQIHHYEDECEGAEPSLVAELDQAIAGWWEIVHRMGDARRVAHGYEPLITEVSS